MIARVSLALVLLATSLSRPCLSQKVNFENIPQQIATQFGTGPLAKLYKIDASINPFYLRGDFDGDGKTDYAVRIRSIQTHDGGIAIWMSSRHQFVILGASKPFKMNNYTVTDFGDLDVWQVYGKRLIEEAAEVGPPPHSSRRQFWLARAKAGTV